MERYVIVKETNRHSMPRYAQRFSDNIHTFQWVHDDNCGDGYTLEEARQILDGYYREDKSRGREGVTHKHFDTIYQSDTDTFRIVNENDL